MSDLLGACFEFRTYIVMHFKSLEDVVYSQRLTPCPPVDFFVTPRTI